MRMPGTAPEWLFLLLALVGGVTAAVSSLRLLRYLALCLRRPRDLRRRYGAWAVVTGPTSGIGRSVALELARRGLNLVLLDIDAANLRETSDTIRSRDAVKTRTLVFDLSLVGTPQGDESMRRLRAAIDGLDVGLLVNNAGMANPFLAYFHEADVEAWLRMVRVNLWALTEVAAAVLPGMVERGRGAVLNMGSASSEGMPSFPLNTIYASTKKYVRAMLKLRTELAEFINLICLLHRMFILSRYVAVFSRSLYVEYRSKGIDVQCQAPMFVATRIVPNILRDKWYLSPLLSTTADAYARAAVRWIGHGAICNPNLSHQLQRCLLAIVPETALDWCLLQFVRRLRAESRGVLARVGAVGNGTDRKNSM
ncbi:very-long-chain 3-oxoacyl-CoA reductase 1 isoform X1 [Setaria viridis]|uniref:very-long-chain 3-oxoacyl-CoA reductase 1 isoform X1 n=1 Tax=Setaria viridis TaxID=4556 RepID=UPI003B3B2120